VKKDELKSKIEECGDAIITYKSPNSKKTKYNVCTIDFDNKYIQEKRNRAKEDESTVLMFCWDTDSFRLMKADNVTSVVPLSAILRNEK
jgi:hypothetical protein